MALEDYIDKTGNCWIWTGCVDKRSGRPKATADGITDRVHRHMFRRSKGPIPKGGYICHTCDNIMCVNPEHLYLGTQTDNMLDMKTKSRGKPGGKSPLTAEQIRSIRASDLRPTELAKQYGVTQPAITRIKQRKTYTWVL